MHKALGHFSLKFSVRTDKYHTLTLYPQTLRFFPDSDFIKWCLDNNLKLKAQINTNE